MLFLELRGPECPDFACKYNRASTRILSCPLCAHTCMNTLCVSGCDPASPTQVLAKFSQKLAAKQNC